MNKYELIFSVVVMSTVGAPGRRKGVLFIAKTLAILSSYLVISSHVPQPKPPTQHPARCTHAAITQRISHGSCVSLPHSSHTAPF